MQQCGWQGGFLLHAVDNSHLLHANVPELRKDQHLTPRPSAQIF